MRTILMSLFMMNIYCSGALAQGLVLDTDTYEERSRETFQVDSILSQRQRDVINFNQPYFALYNEEQFKTLVTNKLVDKLNSDYQSGIRGNNLIPFYRFGVLNEFRAERALASLLKVNLEIMPQALMTCLSSIEYDLWNFSGNTQGAMQNREAANAQVAKCLNAGFRLSALDLDQVSPVNFVNLIENNREGQDYVTSYLQAVGSSLQYRDVVREHRRFVR